MSGDLDEPAPADTQPVSLWALGGAVFAVAAVTIELSGSLLGDAPSSSYPDWLVTIAWPTPVRAAWWLLAAAGAGAAASDLRGSWSTRGRALAGGLAALPFLAFAFGVAIGAQWATWH